MKPIKALICFILPVTLLSGCYDHKEIDETAYIIAVGIDKAKDTDYNYTFQFSAPLAITEGGGGGGESEGGGKASGEGGMKDSNNPGVNNATIKAEDFYVAKNMLNNFLSKNIDMSQLKLIVFSSEVDENGFLSHSQLFLHEREVRPHTCLAVSRESAEEFLRCVNPELEANTAKFYELMALRSNNVYSPVKRLRDFAYESETSGCSSTLPIACVARYEESSDFTEDIKSDSMWVESTDARISSSRSDLRGMAVFKNHRLIGAMDGDSALIYNILNRDIRQCTISVRNRYSSGDTASFRVLVPDRARYKVENSNNGLKIDVNLKLNLEYIGNRLPDGYHSYSELYRDAEEAIKEKISAFFYSTSRNFGADIMKTEKAYRCRFLTNADWEKLGWDELYKTAEFNIYLKTIGEE